jgi:hypothetical protein
MLNPRLIDAIKMITPDSWDYTSLPSEKGLNYEIFDVKESGEEYFHATAGLKEIKDCFQVKQPQNI